MVRQESAKLSSSVRFRLGPPKNTRPVNLKRQISITKTIKDFFGYKFKKEKRYIAKKDDIERAREINAGIIVREGTE